MLIIHISLFIEGKYCPVEFNFTLGFRLHSVLYSITLRSLNKFQCIPLTHFELKTQDYIRISCSKLFLKLINEAQKIILQKENNFF